jgi:hypothetical protein
LPFGRRVAAGPPLSIIGEIPGRAGEDHLAGGRPDSLRGVVEG